jgi:nicotinate-nucleotide--dimethylbenzimidazole phosphoribosyltransferase
VENPLPAAADVPSDADPDGLGGFGGFAVAAASIADVPALDRTAMLAERAAARTGARRLTMPPTSLGRLADVAVWLAGVQGSAPPRPPRRIRAVVLAGDHGIAAAGVCTLPPTTTARRIADIAAGDGALNVYARLVGASVRVVDVAVDSPAPTGPGGVDGTGRADLYRVRRGSGRIDTTDALSVAEAELAFEVGRRIADEEIDAGADLLIPGSVGLGADTAAAALVGALRDAEPIDVVDRGDGTDDQRWMIRTAAIRDALRRARPFASNPRSVLRVVGGADLTALAGLLTQASVRRTPVIVDGVVVCAAALAAERLAPGARVWWLVGNASRDPAARLATSVLGLEPLLDLGLGFEDGTSALAATQLLQAAAATSADLARPAPPPEPAGATAAPSPDAAAGTGSGTGVDADPRDGSGAPVTR